MIKKFLINKGQVALEFGVLVIALVAALLAIQIYAKRGIEGSLRKAADDIGEQFYPDYLEANSAIQSSAYTDIRVLHERKIATIVEIKKVKNVDPELLSEVGVEVNDKNQDKPVLITNVNTIRDWSRTIKGKFLAIQHDE